VKTAAVQRFAACAMAFAIALAAHAADGTREVHGSADAFTAPGVALAWGVLRGSDEATTIVALRIVASADEYAAVAVIGTDPFTQRVVTLLPSTPNSGRFELRVPRAHFADFPRTDIRFERAAAARSDTQPIVVYFLGIPDTTPEFASAAALDAYLTDRLARERNAPAGKIR